MAGFGELVLVLGDFHIPQRRNEIPEQFKRYVNRGPGYGCLDYFIRDAVRFYFSCRKFSL
jgi:hypothetical protein